MKDSLIDKSLLLEQGKNSVDSFVHAYFVRRHHQVGFLGFFKRGAYAGEGGDFAFFGKSVGAAWVALFADLERGGEVDFDKAVGANHLAGFLADGFVGGDEGADAD